MIRFWLKFLDPIGWGLVAKESYLDILEKLIRSKSLPEPNQATKKFAESWLKQMKNHNCLDNED